MTMTLYCSPGACSMAAHMALEESGLPYAHRFLDLKAGEQSQPAYLAINPRGRVPALVDGDFVLTEVPAILRFVAASAPEAGLWPSEPREDGRCAEFLAFVSSTVHPAYAHMKRAYRYATSEAAREDVSETGRRSCLELWNEVEQRLQGRRWAAGENFSVADIYLLVFWLWGRGPSLAYDMDKDFPNWSALAHRMAQRPAIRTVFAKEGLVLPGAQAAA